MSREVDPYASNLSTDDKIYLIQRAKMPTDVMSVADQRKLVDLDAVPLDERANTGDVNTANLSIDQLEELLAARRAEAEEVEPKKLFSNESGTASDDDEDSEPLEPPYNQYTNPQLRAEIERRNSELDEDDEKLALTGTKDELVARLEEDDADDEDDEE